MTGLLAHPLRVTGRLLWLAAELSLAGLSFLFGSLPGGPGHSRRERQAFWLQRGCRRVLRLLHVEVQVTGDVPAEGLLVSNHLSYLDILVLSSLTPALFVAKREVKTWPVFGWLAACGGTLFIDRERRHDVARLNQEIKVVLQSPDTEKRFVNEGAEPQTKTPAELGKYVADEMAKWVELARIAGIRGE